MKTKERTPEEQKQHLIELKEFGARFTKDEWEYLCENRAFQDLLFIDLRAAERLALNLLTGE